MLKTIKKDNLSMNYQLPFKHTLKKEVKKSYKVLLPVTKRKKSFVRGLFFDKKVFYDYLTIKKYTKINGKVLEYLKKKYNQLCIFYKTNQGKAYIYYTSEKIIQLKTCQFFKIEKKINVKNQLKNLLKEYKGLTIYDNFKCYLIEVWS